MHLVMFDIDGTLVESYDFDTECFQAAVKDVIGISVGPDWGRYRHVTDSGILSDIIEQSGLENDRERIFFDVKNQFVSRVEKYISCHDVSPIYGAFDFLSRLVKRQDVVLAFATGGWAESAKMKLDAAGIKLPGIALASSSDHYCRTEIMRVAEIRASKEDYDSKTYFGDGPWDQKASETLGYNFVSVGNRIRSAQSINDYAESDKALRYIGL
ncbi:haloacid dehalogenase [Marinobacterium zhoushanense]|uniref:Haloacid dehalogenase n=1 Tax=Marinobacterium zhoushanense TaxID=1679163 RepID=A0ABQ1KYV9_9GAMM|nr:HAD family hydrolase [Marinobacterium zhoushanense]GGC12260.1 haloacid dehalogenase [Marinobacterium zhoushanense]